MVHSRPLLLKYYRDSLTESARPPAALFIVARASVSSTLSFLGYCCQTDVLVSTFWPISLTSRYFSEHIVALVPQWARTTCLLASSNGTVFL